MICNVKSIHFLDKMSIMKKKNFAQNVLNGKKSDLQRKKYTFFRKKFKYEQNYVAQNIINAQKSDLQRKKSKTFLAK